ncbi:MAG TPA: DoxX family protein, partial [Flavobacteriaceae bacterium]|nr:DoxX family protein [Flavobacteriaceae bacterium]
VRLPKLQAFSEGMLKNFENSMLPAFLTLPFSYILPIAELIVGLFLILGWFTRLSAIVGAAVMLSLIFGSSLVENWTAIPIQLIHIAFFAYVIQHIENNTYAIDNILREKKK